MRCAFSFPASRTRLVCSSPVKVSEAFRRLVDGSLTTSRRGTLEPPRLTPIIHLISLFRREDGRSTLQHTRGQKDEDMASHPQTATATKIKLEPPEALQPMPVHEASGLVPLKGDETSELDQKVIKFVEELAALDSNSPEFGKKVDQLTA